MTYEINSPSACCGVVYLFPAPRFARPNPLGNCSMRYSTTYIPVGVPEGEGPDAAAVSYYKYLPLTVYKGMHC